MDKTKNTSDTVDHLNACIQHHSSTAEWGKIIYSLAGWAEVFATREFDCEVRDYAPKLIERLEMLKQYIGSDIEPFEADIDFLVTRFGLNVGEAKLHIKCVPYLK